MVAEHRARGERLLRVRIFVDAERTDCFSPYGEKRDAPFLKIAAFFGRNGVRRKIAGESRRSARDRAYELHSIGAEILFARKPCLRGQIFIPYAPISRSIRLGVTYLKRCGSFGTFKPKWGAGRQRSTERVSGENPYAQGHRRDGGALIFIEPETRVGL